MRKSEELLFKLIRLALGTESDLTLPMDADWQEVLDLAKKHGVAAIAYDGLQKPYEGLDDDAFLTSLDQDANEDLRYRWFGAMMSVEKNYAGHVKTLARLGALYREAGIPTMLLKGYGLAGDWPVPNHRPPGDINIYQFGRWREGDGLVAARTGAVISNHHHHHSVFHFGKTMVENHYDFLNVHSHRSTRWIEKYLKALAADAEVVDGTGFLLPSADFNACFVMRHAAVHFAAEWVVLRQLVDWAMFVRCHHSEVDWNRVWQFYEKANMHEFVLCIDEICIRNLGMQRKIFHIPEKFSYFYTQRVSLVDRVLNDILKPCGLNESNDTSTYVGGRLKLWWGNRWKHRIVYSDSLFVTFLYQTISHMMKPATLKRQR